MRYFVDLRGPRRHALVLIDKKRDRRFEMSWQWPDDLPTRDFIADRARRWPLVERDFWTAIDVEAPDVLVEAHELGWVNAFEIHARARHEGYFSNTLGQMTAAAYQARFAAAVAHMQATAGQPVRLEPHRGDPVPACRCVCRECAEGDHCGEGRQEGLGDCFYPLKDRSNEYRAKR